MSCNVQCHVCNNGKKDSSYDLCKQFSMSIANVFSSTSLRHCTNFFQDASLSLASHVQKISYTMSCKFLCSFSILLTSVPSELFSRILPNPLYSGAALAKILMSPEGHGNLRSILISGLSFATGGMDGNYILLVTELSQGSLNNIIPFKSGASCELLPTNRSSPKHD